MLGAVALGAAGGAQAAAPRDACPVMRALAADAPAGFPAEKGERLGLAWDDGGGDDEVDYAARVVLPGARGCDVALEHADGGDALVSYRCRFAGAPSKVAQVRRLAALTQRCLGRRPGDRVTLRQGNTVAAADLDRPDYLIGVAATAAPDVTFEISGK